MTAPPQDPIAAIRGLWARGAYHDLVAAASAAPAVLDHDEAAFRVALAHIQTGGLDAAEPILKRILARSPALLDAKAALAKLLLVRGRGGEAAVLVTALEQDVQDDPRAGLILGDVHLQGRRVGDAHRVFLAYKRATGDPIADARLAETYLRMARTEEGVAAARSALAAIGWSSQLLPMLGPAALCAGDETLLQRCLAAAGAMPRQQAASLLSIWVDLLSTGDYLREAARASEFLTERAPTPERLRALADLHLATHDIARATAAAERACALAPEDVDSRVKLARCKLVAGDLADAQAMLQGAVQAAPDTVGAYDYLSQIDPKLIDAGMQAHIAALRARVVNVDDRARLSIALGRAAEAEGDHPGAFGRYAEAKAELAQTAAAGGRGYAAAATEASVRTATGAFPAPLAFAGAVRDRPCPIFVLGMPRSGTTLTEQIIANHPDVEPGGELATMVQISGDFHSRLGAATSAQALIDTRGTAWIARYNAALPEVLRSAPCFTDKHPMNFWSIGLIKALYPDARIVHVMRDPLDTCISIFKQRFQAGYAFANDLDSLAHYYAAYERLMAHWRSVFDGAVFDLRYESLVADPEPTARALIGYCGLHWNEACLSSQGARPIYTHSAAQVRKPINADAVAQWRKFGEAVRPLQDALGRYRAAL